MPFILGTANLFGNYGIGNITKGVGQLGSLTLLKEAHTFGVFRIDTAESYPVVEKFLGSNLNDFNPYKIDSKINLGIKFTETELMQHIYTSLQNLGISNFECLYLHNLNPLMESNIETTKRCLNRILGDGLAKKIGVSVYSEEEIKFSLKKFSNFRSFQILENICDRRLVNSKYLSELNNDGFELNVRSIFLQGLLLSKSDLIPPYLAGAKFTIMAFEDLAAKVNLSRLELCVAYAKAISWASNVVIGVGSLSELIAITNVQMPLPENYIEKIPELPSNLKDPRYWEK